jgi:hypothetical protein
MIVKILTPVKILTGNFYPVKDADARPRPSGG